MKGLYTVLLLIISNIFMTFAWYGNLKLSEMKIITDWPLILIILCSWGLAFFEYSFMIPANRIGSEINGGPFSLVQLKVIQEVISLNVFMFFLNNKFSKNCSRCFVEKRPLFLIPFFKLFLFINML